MVFTALPPPPPMPITLIFAVLVAAPGSDNSNMVSPLKEF